MHMVALGGPILALSQGDMHMVALGGLILALSQGNMHMVALGGPILALSAQIGLKNTALTLMCLCWQGFCKTLSACISKLEIRTAHSLFRDISRCWWCCKEAP